MSVAVPTVPHHRPRPDARGMSLSVFWCLAVIAILLAAGLAVDGAAQAHARRTCQTAAAQVARAGADAAAAARLDLSMGDARTAALAAATNAAKAHPALTISVAVAGDGSLTVKADVDIPTYFLTLAGIRTLHASGGATADLRNPNAP